MRKVGEYQGNAEDNGKKGWLGRVMGSKPSRAGEGMGLM
jgi:hypothetical protein